MSSLLLFLTLLYCFTVSEFTNAAIERKRPLTRTLLEKKIENIQLSLDQAMQRKDFTACSELQDQLESLIVQRHDLPTVSELREMIRLMESEIAVAAKNRDFESAADGQNRLTDAKRLLEEGLAADAVENGNDAPAIQEQGVGNSAEKEVVEAVLMIGGNEVTIESRFDLDKMISQVSSSLSKAVAAKDFKSANELQTIVDKMTGLRSSFPTPAELKEQLRSLRVQIDQAVSQKSFSLAEELNQQVGAIEAKLTSMQSSPRDFNAGIHVKEMPRIVSSGPVVPSVPSSVSSAKLVTPPSATRTPGPPSVVKSVASGKPVHKLRPAKPFTSPSTASIRSVATMLSSKRANSCIVLGPDGQLAGIVTDTDFTRRAVAKQVDPDSTPISNIMTPNPTCVFLNEPAMDALTTMLENHFRHLPVTDVDGTVVGLLDISKCLNEAIAKLEAIDDQSQSASAASDIVQQVIPGVAKERAAEMHALLSKLMTQAMGGKSLPTLRSLMQGKPSTFVSPTSTIRESSFIMAENRRAVLVVDEGHLVGIFGFKDMMSRAIAKQMDFDSTPVSEVMTLEPESVSPDLTVIDALQIMADNKFLSLPVVEADGQVVGLVDVMDVIYGCGGTDGWRSIFSSAIDLDDLSDVSSTQSYPKPRKSQPLPIQEKMQAVTESVEERSVARLRPSKPVVVSCDESVLQTVKLLGAKRTGASLVVNFDGSLAGIMTEKDVTLRMVAKHLDARNTPIADVMSPNPTCVGLNDPAMEALTLMVDNRFRYLPVVDGDGSVVGTLDIGKCLTSVIRKLERFEQNDISAAQGVVEQVISAQGTSEVHAAALQALLGNLVSQAMGGSAIPTLRSILRGRPSTIVSPDTSVRDAGKLMADNRRAALIVDDGRLIGIFGFKDMMNRAVAKELDLDKCYVDEVMTPEPEFVSPEMTVLEAMQIMTDNAFLTLPVCEEDGRVVGLVDVIDIIYGCGGTEGWKSLFTSAFELSDDCTSASSRSNDNPVHTSVTDEGSIKRSKTVKKLRPSKAHLSLTSESIVDVAQLLQRKRGDASLVVYPEGALAGIVTDTDFTRRVVAKGLDPATTPVVEIITPDPMCVSLDDPAMEALECMIENHFRHLPVVDAEGAVVGVLDIGKCLDAAIAKLERSGSKRLVESDDLLKSLGIQNGQNGAQTAALQALLGTLLSQAGGGKEMPTLGWLLKGKPSTIVSPWTTIREAGVRMAESRHAALIVDDGRLIGIFGFKDMMNRAIAKELPLDITPISEVMTPNPEFVSPDLTVLEALQTMYDHKFLTLPVVDGDGCVVGLVDVMDVIYGCGGTEGWRSVFSSAMDLDEAASKSTGRSGIKSGRPDTAFASRIPSHIPTTLEFDEDRSITGSTLGDMNRSGIMSSFQFDDCSRSTSANTSIFKVTDPSGQTHRVKCPPNFSLLLKGVAAKANMASEQIQLQYIDEEGDTVIITGDDDVAEAWDLARQTGTKVVKLVAKKIEKSGVTLEIDQNHIALGLAGVVAFIGVLYLVFSKPKRM